VTLVNFGGRSGVRCLKVGVVDRRSEEQGVEAGSSATQLIRREYRSRTLGLLSETVIASGSVSGKPGTAHKSIKSTWLSPVIPGRITSGCHDPAEISDQHHTVLGSDD
jgi:hypothetical protein